MKYLILLIGLLGLGLGSHAQSIALNNCEFRLFTSETPDGIPFYAIQSKDEFRTGSLVFSAGTPGWTYRCSLNGNPVDGFTYAGDSSYLELYNPEAGMYLITAEKPDEASLSSGNFRIFYVSVPDFNVSIPEEFRRNCSMTRIDVSGFTPQTYDGNFPSADYQVSWRRNEENWHTIVGLSLEQVNHLQIPDERIAFFEDRGQDAVYQVKITDEWGFEWENEVEYESVFPKADMELELLNTVDVVGEVNDEMGQAPLEVVFHNNSQQAVRYEWYLYKDTAEIHETALTLLDSLIENKIRDDAEFSYTYLHPGRYQVRLKVFHESGCVDTTAAAYVNVVESLVNVPNVFTPNGDGKNDVFRAQCLSVESFEGVILNRWGRKLYEWHDPQEGWDGRIHGKYASPGTYYYIITARGREKNNPPKYVKKGALLLVR